MRLDSQLGCCIGRFRRCGAVWWTGKAGQTGRGAVCFKLEPLEPVRKRKHGGPLLDAHTSLHRSSKEGSRDLGGEEQPKSLVEMRQPKSNETLQSQVDRGPEAQEGRGRRVDRKRPWKQATPTQEPGVFSLGCKREGEIPGWIWILFIADIPRAHFWNSPLVFQRWL